MDASLLSNLKEAPDRPRAFKRFPVNLTVTVTPASADMAPARHTKAKKRSSKVTASVENISLNGLSFTAPAAFAPNRLLLIEITIWSRPFLLLATVRRCRIAERLGRRVCETGVQFMKTSATADFVPVLAKYLAQRLPA